MTINDDKTVAAVAAPVTSKEVKEKIKKQKTKAANFYSTFSFTDDKMARATCKNGIKQFDRRFDTKVPGLCVCIYSRVV